jgi:acyl-coenzyme A thioesterase 13
VIWAPAYSIGYDQGFEESLMTRDLELISATGPPHVTCVFEMTMTPMYGSRMGNAQGAALSLIHDMCTTMAMAPLATKDFWHFGGVSRVLSVTYLRPTKTGTRIIIECEVLQVGKRFGMYTAS